MTVVNRLSRLSRRLGVVLALLLGVVIPQAGGRAPAAFASTATLYVATTGDDANTCLSAEDPCATIAAALGKAPSGASVIVAAGMYSETVVISKDVTLAGAGAGETIVDGGNRASVVTVVPATAATLSGLTIQHGHSWDYFDSIDNTGNGGGIDNTGAVTVENTVVTSNTAYGEGGGIYTGQGMLTVLNSQIVDNTSVLNNDNTGGGIDLEGGSATITGSSISGNVAGFAAGGLMVDSGAITLSQSTVADNSALLASGITNSGSLQLVTTTVQGNHSTLSFPGQPDDGGGVYNTGVLTASASVISANVSHGAGGGIGDYGAQSRVTLIDSSVLSNTAVTDGGGISNRADYPFGSAGTVVLQNSTVAGNTALFGAGISNSGALTLTGSQVLGNSTVMTTNAQLGGGGIFNDITGTVTLTSSSVSSNTVLGSSAGGAGSGQPYGGGLENLGAASIVSSTIDGNSAALHGGGVENTGTLSVSDSTVSANSAVTASYIGTGGGGIENDDGALSLDHDTVSANSASNGDGGGIENSFGTMTITASTIATNTAAQDGGLWNFTNSTAALVNSTVSGNSAAGGYGGGLGNAGSLALTNVSISGNSAADAGGIRAYGPVSLANTILAGNAVTPGGSSPDCSGSVVSQGYNIVGDGTGCAGIANGVQGDRVGTAAQPLDPHLGALQDNGGPTMTMALLPASIASDAVPASNCTLSTDQRDAPRPDEPADAGACDVGAYEGFPNATLGISPTTTAPLETIALTGANFLGGEPVAVYVDNTSTTPLLTPTSSASGAVSATIKLPQTISGAHAIIAVGQTSGLSATASLQVRPLLLLSPHRGKAGSSLRALGFGFVANDTVKVYWDKPWTLLGSTHSNSSGSFYGATAITSTVPLSATSGVHDVYAIGQAGHDSAIATFSVHS